ncbi:MAG TPA: Nif3-like dinuclear metal center hexameric protein [Bacteroidota bacterium]|nr:Nif3-like dinuclear metal center hexameric protein [Bacteroidota bacterium]
MVVADVLEFLELWAPREIAWDRDNIGLQVGSLKKKVQNILVTLDVSEEVVNEAKRKNVDLIISHHPLIFHHLRCINGDEGIGRLIEVLIKNNIALCTTHTNLDSAHSGVSFELANRLDLQNIDFLSKNFRVQKKIVVFVPLEYSNKVMEAMASAGAGKIGDYELCSFSTEGSGTFIASKNSSPFIGKVGRLERVSEVRLEMILPSWKLNNVIQAMRMAHPYEEIAFDVYNLDNVSNEYGMGALGDLNRGMVLKKFLMKIKRDLKTPLLRFSGNLKKIIRRVAVCGGSGSDLLSTAIQRGADAFITADIKYHTFLQCDHRIALVDAGHYETEQPIVKKIVHYLRKRKAVRVFSSRSMANPVQYY